MQWLQNRASEVIWWYIKVHELWFPGDLGFSKYIYTNQNDQNDSDGGWYVWICILVTV